MYKPREDTFLLIESLNKYGGDIAIEIGVGSGLVCENLKKSSS